MDTKFIVAFYFWKATIHFVSIKKTISSPSSVPEYIIFIFFLSSHLLRFFLSLPSLFLSFLCALSSLWVFCWSTKRAWVCRLETWWLTAWWLIRWLGLADLGVVVVNSIVIDSMAWACRSRPRLANLFLLSFGVMVVNGIKEWIKK